MAATFDRRSRSALHPLHAVLLAGTIPCFLGAALSDWAYAASYQIQWNNFASWLLVGGLAFAACALVWAIANLFGSRRRVSYALLLLATWGVGFVDALVHARDAWAGMPTGLVLSVVVALLACAATWAGFSAFRAGSTP